MTLDELAASIAADVVYAAGPPASLPDQAIADYIRERLAPLFVERDALLAACRKAVQFINNGVDLGYIHLPEPGSGGTDRRTLPMLEAAIALAEQP